MIYLISGPDSYRAKEKLKEIIEEYKAKNFTPIIFQGKELSVPDLTREFRFLSMFAPQKLIVIYSLFENKKLKEDFLKEIDKFQSQEIIIFETKEISPKEKLYETIKQKGKIFVFPALRKSELKTWIKNELKREGFSIEDIAIQTLIDFVGDDLWRIKNELQKLKAYKFPIKKIQTEDVLRLVKPKIDFDIFKTIDAIAARQKKTALRLLNKHLKIGESPIYILSMINYQFRNLLILKEGEDISELQKETGLSPFQIKKANWQASQFTLERLKKLYRKIFQIDLGIKTGQIEPEEGLELLVLDT